MSQSLRRVVITAAALSSLAGLPVAAQEAVAPDAGTAVRRTTGDPRRDTLVRLTRPISVDFQDKRLEDIAAFIQTSSGAEIEPLWVDEQHPEGLDKEKVVSVKVDNATFLQLIEKVLEKARSDTGENSWQMTETGAFQMGPKTRLNQYKRVEIYDINDLLLEVPNYTDVPRIDLQQALQAAGSSGGGGGGGQSPFREEGNDRQNRLRERKERADELTQLLQQLVEPDQWVDNGGNGGSMRYYNGTLIVNAPDYMHRGLNGYPYWPSRATTRAIVDGRRYVSLTGDTGLSHVVGFGQAEVSAVVGGQVIRSNQSPGGGR
jgi:hypothetical protein